MASRGRGVTFEPLEPPHAIQMVNVQVRYEPSVYGGDGTETRKNIVFSVPPDVLRNIKTLEAPLDIERLCSCIKGADSLKCKINMDKVRVYNLQGATIEPPTEWRGLVVNVLATVKGTWTTKTLTGLSLEVQDIQVTGAAHSAPRECPFAAVLAA